MKPRESKKYNFRKLSGPGSLCLLPYLWPLVKGSQPSIISKVTLLIFLTFPVHFLCFKSVFISVNNLNILISSANELHALFTI